MVKCMTYIKLSNFEKIMDPGISRAFFEAYVWPEQMKQLCYKRSTKKRFEKAFAAFVASYQGDKHA